jgi:DDE superfamily endonuclease
MIVPIVAIPPSIELGLAPYRDLFPRIETYQHIKEYCTGLGVLEKPSINRLAACLVEGPAQSSINQALTRSPWSGDAVNERRLERIQRHHQGKGLTIGIIDSTFSHHPRGEKEIYGVYRYWDYVNGCYTYAIQLVTAAIATGERCDGFDYRIYHRFHQQAELAYLEHTRLPPDEPDRGKWLQRLIELLAYELHRRQHQTKPQLAAALIEQMAVSEVAPQVYTVDSALFAPVMIEAIEKHGKPWLADSEKTRLVFWQGQTFNCETFAQSRPDQAYRPVTLNRHGQEKTFWVFTCVVRIKKYGKVRLAVIYDQPDRQANRFIVLPGC